LASGICQEFSLIVDIDSGQFVARLRSEGKNREEGMRINRLRRLKLQAHHVLWHIADGG